MNDKDDFFVGYLDQIDPKTRRSLKRFVIGATMFIIIAAMVFSFAQKPFKNSTFELTSATKITGTFHENPYPMLRVEIVENTFKNILLLGFGKSSANPYLQKLQNEYDDLDGKTLSIEGNLIYYNGKTLIQITDEEKVTLVNSKKMNTPEKHRISEMILYGEIIDPKCYFGVMKPGKGKIHRSCAVRCISGGIPPVLVTTDGNNISQYYLLTNLHGNPIHEAVLSFIGQPSKISGIVEKMEDWYILKIKPNDIKLTGQKSQIY